MYCLVSKTKKSIKELPKHLLHKRNCCSPPPEAAHSVSAIIRAAEFKFDCVTVCGWSYGLTPCSYSTLHTLTLQWAHKILQFLSHPLQTATKKRNIECMLLAGVESVCIFGSAPELIKPRECKFIHRERAHSDTYSSTSLALALPVDTELHLYTIGVVCFCGKPSEYFPSYFGFVVNDLNYHNFFFFSRMNYFLF